MLHILIRYAYMHAFCTQYIYVDASLINLKLLDHKRDPKYQYNYGKTYHVLLLKRLQYCKLCYYYTIIPIYCTLCYFKNLDLWTMKIKIINIHKNTTTDLIGQPSREMKSLLICIKNLLMLLCKKRKNKDVYCLQNYN